MFEYRIDRVGDRIIPSITDVLKQEFSAQETLRRAVEGPAEILRRASEGPLEAVRQASEGPVEAMRRAQAPFQAVIDEQDRLTQIIEKAMPISPSLLKKLGA